MVEWRINNFTFHEIRNNCMPLLSPFSSQFVYNVWRPVSVAISNESHNSTRAVILLLLFCFVLQWRSCKQKKGIFVLPIFFLNHFFSLLLLKINNTVHASAHCAWIMNIHAILHVVHCKRHNNTTKERITNSIFRSSSQNKHSSPSSLFSLLWASLSPSSAACIIIVFRWEISPQNRSYILSGRARALRSCEWTVSAQPKWNFLRN